MKTIAVILANGMEELEALTPVDVLRRAGARVDIIALQDKKAVGSHNITVLADYNISEVNLIKYDAIILPGGMPGAKNISDNEIVVGAVSAMLEMGKLVCAICASPAVILAKHNLLEGYTATCYPALEFILAMGGSYRQQSVEVSKNLITANGPKSAMEFALKICEYLGISPKF
jgi:4-methyl-5(b-hydroxyethyl)-thiazole monophosphate biosynthesis